VLPYIQKVSLNLLAIIIPKVVHFRRYAMFPGLQPFENLSWKPYSVRLFSNAHDSAWRPFRFIFNRGKKKNSVGGDDSHVVFGYINTVKENVRNCALSKSKSHYN
jgi:hypothetical protein